MKFPRLDWCRLPSYCHAWCGWVQFRIDFEIKNKRHYDVLYVRFNKGKNAFDWKYIKAFDRLDKAKRYARTWLNRNQDRMLNGD